MSFQARYPGRCGSCEERIHVGDSVQYEDDELVHADCPTPAVNQFTVGPRESLCASCFTIHAGECM